MIGALPPWPGMATAYLILTIDRDGTKRADIYSEFPLTQWHGHNERQFMIAVQRGRTYGEAEAILERWVRRHVSMIARQWRLSESIIMQRKRLPRTVSVHALDTPHPVTLEEARAAKEKLRAALGQPTWLRGIGIGVGNPTPTSYTIRVLTAFTGVPKLPSHVDGVPVDIAPVGDIRALAEPATTASGEMDAASGATRGLAALAVMVGVALVATPLAKKVSG